MNVNAEEMKPVATRLKRARGQLDAIIRMLEEGDDCSKIVTQVAAVSTAVDRAGYLIISNSLKQCIQEQGPESIDEKELEKLFLALA